MPDTIWIAVLRISERTAHKLRSRHRLDPDGVRLAIECVEGLHYRWHDHPQRGRRVMIVASIEGDRVLVVLYPHGDSSGGVWNLGSAYRI